MIKVRHNNMCPVFPIASIAAPRFRVSTDMEFRNHIVAKEMPDSLATMYRISSNILFYAILANKMAFSLATVNCDDNAVTIAFPITFSWIEL